MNDPLIAIGKIGRPFALEGDIVVYPLGKTLEQLSVPREIIIADEAGSFSKTVTLTALAKMNQGIKCKLSTFDSPEASETLKGMFLFIAQEHLPEQADTGGFYHFELKGMAVVAGPENRLVGEVVDVHNYPTTDAIEIKKLDGTTFIVGLDPAIVRAIDRQKRVITISLDLLEEIL
ncbi:MAG: ribosome maturation factor RimM [Chitinivibrionales bacterium]|nr:ribosome maturation factor RimM [Chitinivibrionales bacterium]